MKYTIVAIGKIKKGFFREGCDLYKDRLSKLADINEIEKKPGTKHTKQEKQEEESRELINTKEVDIEHENVA